MYRYNAEKAQNKEFRFADELVSYCEMDVEILRKGCMKYRQLLKDKQGVDPFAVATTIASSCMDCYRRNFLKENTIGIVPAGGYRKNDKQSIIAIKWLKWLSEQNGLDIQHAKNGGEVCLLFVVVCLYYIICTYLFRCAFLLTATITKSMVVHAQIPCISTNSTVVRSMGAPSATRTAIVNCHCRTQQHQRPCATLVNVNRH